MPRYIGYKPTGTANTSVTVTSTSYPAPFLLKNHEDLVFLIDVADSNSYSGSGSTLVNLCTSPADGSAASAYNFTLGAGFTFTGVAGDLKRTTYLTHAGAASSDSIISVATNTTFIESLHKDNANWTAIVIWFKGNGGNANYGHLMSTGSYTPSSGIGWYSLNGSNARYGLNVMKSVSGQVALNVVGTEYIDPSTYNFMSVSINEASASGGFYYRNGKYDQTASSLIFNPTYSSPSTSAAQYTLRFWNGGSSGGVTYPMLSTDRFIAAMMFNRALSKAELDDIYNALSARVMTDNACSLADTTITIPSVRPAKPLQGYPGGTTTGNNAGQSGGGGAGAAGAANLPASSTGGAGGAGKTSPLDSTARAGGGGGAAGATPPYAPGPGGSGGGGAGGGGPGVPTDGTPGSTNTGGGGGGGAVNLGTSGSGGPGIVMFTTPPSVTATFSPGVTSSSTTVPPSSPVAGGEKLYKVTATTDRSQTFSVNGAVPSSHWLVVGGGGAGGNHYAGGGGAGGYRTSTPETPGGPGTSAEPVFNWSPGTTYPVFVGLGGSGTPNYPAYPAGSLGNKGHPSGLNGVEADGGGGGGSINMLGGLGPGGGIGASGGGMGYTDPGTSSPAGVTFGAAMATEASEDNGTTVITVDKKYNSGIWSISGTGTNSVYGRRRAGNWLTTTRPYDVEYLVVAGAGGGAGGGGGAGEYLTNSSLVLIPGTTYTVTVGAGGALGSATGSNASKGTDSSLSGANITTVTAEGGGYGAGAPGGFNTTENGGAGGSGGGAASWDTGGGAGTGGSSNTGGNNGGGCNDGGSGSYNAGGGGGSASAGTTGTGDTGLNGGASGGAGTSNSITGSSVTYAAGGDGYFASGGSAGGTNTGDGGDGRNWPAGGVPGSNGHAGGSGVVILRMLTADYSGTTTGSPTVTTDGSYTVLQYNSSGSYTA